MSNNNNNKNNNNNRANIYDELSPKYNVVPMDLNSSPLQDYFERQAAISLKDTDKSVSTAATKAHDNGKTMPVLIPLGISKSTHGKKKPHHKRRRKPVAQTLPEDILEAVLQRRQNVQQPPFLPASSAKFNNNKVKNGSRFIVGSLQEKPPVPWPTTLTTTPDNLRRLTNRNTVNWPLLPETYGSSSKRTTHSCPNGNDEEDDIFSMDGDFYSSSDEEEEEFCDILV